MQRNTGGKETEVVIQAIVAGICGYCCIVFALRNCSLAHEQYKVTKGGVDARIFPVDPAVRLLLAVDSITYRSPSRSEHNSGRRKKL